VTFCATQISPPLLPLHFFNGVASSVVCSLCAGLTGSAGSNFFEFWNWRRRLLPAVPAPTCTQTPTRVSFLLDFVVSLFADFGSLRAPHTRSRHRRYDSLASHDIPPKQPTAPSRIQPARAAKGLPDPPVAVREAEVPPIPVVPAAVPRNDKAMADDAGPVGQEWLRALPKPSPFTGDPRGLDAWLESMQSFMMMMSVPAEKYTLFASHFLKDDVSKFALMPKSWYTINSKKYGTMTWAEFSNVMIAAFMPADYKEKYVTELNAVKMLPTDSFTDLVQRLQAKRLAVTSAGAEFTDRELARLLYMILDRDAKGFTFALSLAGITCKVLARGQASCPTVAYSLRATALAWLRRRTDPLLSRVR
jgi:hypothetical protein